MSRLKSVWVNTLFALLFFASFLFLTDKAILLFGMKPVMKSFPFVEGKDSARSSHPLLKNYYGTYATGEYSISIKTNSLGFRSPEFAIEKGKDTFRVLVLGDSFAFGQGVENIETFSSLLEDRLNSLKRAVKYEVINTGYPGASPYAEMEFFRNYGIGFNPDLVILAFFAGNDILEDLLNSKPMSRAETLALTANYITARKWRIGLIGFLRNIFERSLPNFYEFVTVRLVKLKYKFGGHRTTFDYMMLKDYPEDIDEGWRISSKAIGTIKDLCSQNNIEFVVVVIPFQEQFLANLDEGIYARNKPQGIISRYCKENHILCLDLLPVFKIRAKESLYYLKDGHWTSEGHRVAYESILDFLMRKDLLKKTPNRNV